MAGDKKILLLIDTFGLLYRFYHMLPKMKTTSGTYTSAIYGLTRVLMKIFKESRPDMFIAGNHR